MFLQILRWDRSRGRWCVLLAISWILSVSHLYLSRGRIPRVILGHHFILTCEIKKESQSNHMSGILGSHSFIQVGVIQVLPHHSVCDGLLQTGAVTVKLELFKEWRVSGPKVDSDTNEKLMSAQLDISESFSEIQNYTLFLWTCDIGCCGNWTENWTFTSVCIYPDDSCPSSATFIPH